MARMDEGDSGIKAGHYPPTEPKEKITPLGDAVATDPAARRAQLDKIIRTASDFSSNPRSPDRVRRGWAQALSEHRGERSDMLHAQYKDRALKDLTDTELMDLTSNLDPSVGDKKLKESKEELGRRVYAERASRRAPEDVSGAGSRPAPEVTRANLEQTAEAPAWTDQHRQLAKERLLDSDVHSELGGHGSRMTPEQRAAVQANAPDLLAQHDAHLRRAALLRDKAPHEMSEAEFVDAHTDPDFTRILGRDGHGEKHGRALAAVWTPEKHAQWEKAAEAAVPPPAARLTAAEGNAYKLARDRAYSAAQHKDLVAAARPALEETRAKLEQTAGRSKVDYHVVAADATARLAPGNGPRRLR